jgi:hypothetical protein
MATKPSHRNKNIGSFFLNHLAKIASTGNKYFILETEDPEYGNNKDERERRINFYKRNGANLIEDARYMLPALQGSGETEMRLMIFPEYHNGTIEAELVRKLVTQIYREVYGRDVNHSLLDMWIPATQTTLNLV